MRYKFRDDIIAWLLQEGISHAEIAKHLGKQQATVTQQLGRSVYPRSARQYAEYIAARKLISVEEAMPLLFPDATAAPSPITQGFLCLVKRTIAGCTECAIGVIATTNPAAYVEGLTERHRDLGATFTLMVQYRSTQAQVWRDSLRQEHARYHIHGDWFALPDSVVEALQKGAQ